MTFRGALLAGTAAVALGAPASAAAGPYVALGDSVAAGGSTYVAKLYPHYQSTLGADQLLNRAIGGATTTSLINGGQLATALADIDAPSDTRAVTIDIGGNDYLGGGCTGECFRGNLASILEQLDTALAGDPGEEPLTAMAYYNPGVGTAMEAEYDTALLGDNFSIGCEDTAAAAGLNDIIFQEAARLSLPVANPYVAFKAGGQSLMGDAIHPNAAGHDVIAQAFRDASLPDCENPPTANPDVTAPQTTITRAPANRIDRHRATYRFTSSEPSSTFECRLDSGGWEPCSSPATVKRLARGRHKLRVRAIDAAGNVDPSPDRDRFRVTRRR